MRRGHSLLLFSFVLIVPFAECAFRLGRTEIYGLQYVLLKCFAVYERIIAAESDGDRVLVGAGDRRQYDVAVVGAKRFEKRRAGAAEQNLFAIAFSSA